MVYGRGFMDSRRSAMRKCIDSKLPTHLRTSLLFYFAIKWISCRLSTATAAILSVQSVMTSAVIHVQHVPASARCRFMACPMNPALARGHYSTREDSCKARVSGWQVPRVRGDERHSCGFPTIFRKIPMVKPVQFSDIRNVIIASVRFRHIDR